MDYEEWYVETNKKPRRLAASREILKNKEIRDGDKMRKPNIPNLSNRLYLETTLFELQTKLELMTKEHEAALAALKTFNETYAMIQGMARSINIQLENDDRRKKVSYGFKAPDSTSTEPID